MSYINSWNICDFVLWAYLKNLLTNNCIKVNVAKIRQFFSHSLLWDVEKYVILKKDKNLDKCYWDPYFQVFNGVLLPFFSICLLLCINDSQFMGSRPQTGWANGFLIVSVTITLFLASNVLIQKIIGAYINVVSNFYIIVYHVLNQKI